MVTSGNWLCTTPYGAAMSPSLRPAAIERDFIVRAYEQANEGRRTRGYRLLARHRGTGALAGHTVVAVEAERPEIGHQHDTSVVREHRGHRLGLLLKTGMLRWLGEVEPQLRTVDTWNTETNGPMIAVNERLSYRMLGRALEFQRPL